MVTLKINGESHTVDASPDMPLLWVLRDLLGMNGTKFGCGVALCGACTVHLDGIPRRSCVMPISAAAGHSITTIEGVGASATGKRVQQAWLDLEVIQCGYCQSGQIIAAAALLAKIPTPTDTDCRVTFAAAAPIPGSERPSSRRLANRRMPRRRADHGPDVASPAPLHERGRRRWFPAGAAS
jgi:isoquinoline 1-oxidoreductase subunit alpha